jgi:zona occludens toxin (predicted ATPase)
MAASKILHWRSTRKLLLLLLAPLLLMALLMPPAAAADGSSAATTGAATAVRALAEQSAAAAADYYSSAVSTAVLSNAAPVNRPAAAVADTAVTATAVTDKPVTADTGVAHLSMFSVALGLCVMSVALVCSWFFSLGLEWQYVVAAFRTTAQLSVLGG